MVEAWETGAPVSSLLIAQCRLRSVNRAERWKANATEGLDLRGRADVTDEVLAGLPLSSILWHNIDGTSVTDDSVEAILGIPRLLILHAAGTRVSDEGIARLRE